MKKFLIFTLSIFFSLSYSQFNTVYNKKNKTVNYEIKKESNTGNVFLDNKPILIEKPKKESKKEKKKNANFSFNDSLNFYLEKKDKQIIKELPKVPEIPSKNSEIETNLISSDYSVATFPLIKTESKSKNYSKKLISMPLDRMLITSDYGYRIHPIFGEGKFHQGVDLRANYDNVYSIMDGYVAEAGYTSANGNYIAIQHLNFKTYYLHLSNILVNVNERIYAGQFIAISGNTGSSTAPHLHFAVKENGNFVNPITFLNDLIIANNTFSTYGNNRQISKRGFN